MERSFHIAQDFSAYPGGRYRKDGPCSGEELRENYLLPMLDKARINGETLVVWLDGAAGYAAAFLHEAFGKLADTKGDVSQILRVEAISARYKHHAVLARKYIAQRRDPI